MQTLLKVVFDNRGQASMVHDYLALFHAKAAANEAQFIESLSSDTDDVAFARDDAREFRDNGAERERAQLGSFGQVPNQANSKNLFIFVNPIILSFRRNGPNLRLWVESPSPGAAANPESE